MTRDGIDPRIEASHARAVARNGQSITVRRINGQAPRAALVSAVVPATVQDYLPDGEAVTKTGYSAREMGAIGQGDRQILLMLRDLRAQRFPLPVRKDDMIILASGDMLNIVSVDAEKRRRAGAIEIRAAGVA